MELGTYQCGCVGFAPYKDGVAALIQTCDTPDSCAVMGRNMSAKTFVPIATDDAKNYWQATVVSAMNDSIAYEKLRSVLREAVKP